MPKDKKPKKKEESISDFMNRTKKENEEKNKNNEEFYKQQADAEEDFWNEVDDRIDKEEKDKEAKDKKDKKDKEAKDKKEKEEKDKDKKDKEEKDKEEKDKKDKEVKDKKKKKKTKPSKSIKDDSVIIPIMNKTEIALPEYFAEQLINKKTGAISYKLVNPLTKVRNLSTRKKKKSIKLIRKPIEDAVIMEHSQDPIPLSLFSKTDQDIINKHFDIIDKYSDVPLKWIPKTKDFKNKERGRPEMMSKNIDVNRSRDKDSDVVVEVIGNKKMTDNANPKNKGEKEKEKEKPKRKNVRRKPLKYAGKTDEEIRRIVQNQKNESGKLRVETEKYGLEEALRLKEERRQQDLAKGDNWFQGLITPKAIVKKSLLAKELLANAGGEAIGNGLTENVINHFNSDNKDLIKLKKSFDKHMKTENMVDKEKNIIFSNIMGKKQSKKNIESDSESDSDLEGMGLYAGGGGLYASTPSSGRGIKHMHHFHRIEMDGKGIIHHHHHIEGGSIKSIGNDIKKAFQPVKKAFEPVKQAIDKVEQVATPYNAEVLGHYLIPSVGSAVGGVLGSVGGPVGGVLGSAGGSYGGYQLQKELGFNDNTTFKGMGLKNKKGSAEAKEWGKRMREAREAKKNK